MSEEHHHQGALIETARVELDRAHRGVLAMDAGEVRRGLQLALAALREASGLQSGPASQDARLDETVDKLAKALADLDGGSLIEMDTLIESVRTELA